MLEKATVIAGYIGRFIWSMIKKVWVQLRRFWDFANRKIGN